MTGFLKFGIGALFAYVIAAPLTSTISMDVSKTEWSNLWTYVYWSLGLFIWLAIFAIGALLIAGLFSLFSR